MRTTAPPTGRLGLSSPFFGSLSTSLFLWLFGIVIAAFTTYALISIRSTSEQWMELIQMGANRCSEVIRRSTHYSMMLNERESVHEIIQTVAKAPGVGSVRVYDKQGAIIYSAATEEIGHKVDLQAEACVVCHSGGKQLESPPSDERTRVYRTPEGEHVLGLINPIYNAPECYNADCHAHPRDQTVLGVLDVTMSLSEADASLADARRMVIAAAVLMALLVGASSAVFIYRVVRRPVRRLIEGTERVAHGDLETEIRPSSRNEIGQLAEAFNSMTRDLEQAQTELTEWSHKLEQKVVEKTEALSQTQKQVVHMEKMASLGKLAATVAHELNNPLAGILTYAKLVERSLRDDDLSEDEKQELGRYLTLIQKESARCGDIVRNLLLFAKHAGVEFALHSINEIVERSLLLMRHHLEMAGVQQESHLLADNDDILCDANQIQQALVALFVNAVEAMPNGGTLKIDVEPAEDSVRLTVSDSGVGIPAEVRPQIFEPFFSTKEGANGLGLGLAVVYGIIRRHRGEIGVSSGAGQGTEFTIRLPRRPTLLEDETENGRSV